MGAEALVIGSEILVNLEQQETFEEECRSFSFIVYLQRNPELWDKEGEKIGTNRNVPDRETQGIF